MPWDDTARAEHKRETDRYPSDLTDAEWDIIGPLLPPAKTGGRPRKTKLREIMNAILYMATSGCQWRMLPTDFPPRSTVQGYFYDWAEVAARAKALSAREDASARKRARRLAKERKPETAMDDALGRATQDAGRVVAMPRRSREHETPALAAAGKAAEAAEQPADRAASDRRHGMKSAAGGTSRSVMDAMRRHYLEEDL